VGQVSDGAVLDLAVLLFLIRSELGVLDFEGYIPETLAEGYSYLLFQYSQRVGANTADLGGIDPERIRKEEYFQLIKDATSIRQFWAWEFLVDYFGYRCRCDDDGIFRIEAPNSEFQKALRWGFIATSIQTTNFLAKADNEKAMSLRATGHALLKVMQAKGLVQKRENPHRWAFDFPGAEKLREFVKSEKYFREELTGLSQGAKELFVSIPTLENFEIGGVKIATLIRCQRLINLLRFAAGKFFASQIRTQAVTIAQSLIPVFSREQLLSLLEFGSSRSEAERVLELLAWNREKAKVFDAMYQPLIEMNKDMFMVPMNMFGSADLVRNLLMLNEQRLSDGKSDPLGRLFKDVLSSATPHADCDRKYKFAGENGDIEKGDIDSIALIGTTLFIFECKNSLHPCSTFELRTSWDYMLHAQEQLDRFLRLWVQPEFRNLMSQKLDWDLSGVSEVVSCIVTGNRMFNGIRLGSHSVRSFYELGNFILDGAVIIFDQKVNLRTDGPLTAEALKKYIQSDLSHKKIFAALLRDDMKVNFGDTQVFAEDYHLDLATLAAEFGVPLPSEIHNSEE